MRSTYLHFIDSGVNSINTYWIWSIKCPSKVRVFLWLVHKNSLLTWPALQRRDWLCLNFCVLCSKHGKSTHHLMLNCKFTNDLWIYCARKLGINLNMGEDNCIWSRLYFNGRPAYRTRSLIAAICWNALVGKK